MWPVLEAYGAKILLARRGGQTVGLMLDLSGASRAERKANIEALLASGFNPVSDGTSRMMLPGRKSFTVKDLKSWFPGFEVETMVDRNAPSPVINLEDLDLAQRAGEETPAAERQSEQAPVAPHPQASVQSEPQPQAGQTEETPGAGDGADAGRDGDDERTGDAEKAIDDESVDNDERTRAGALSNAVDSGGESEDRDDDEETSVSRTRTRRRKILDAGEKIGGARKDLYGKRSEAPEPEDPTLPEDGLRVRTLWPYSFKDAYERGVPCSVAFWMDMLRSGMPEFEELFSPKMGADVFVSGVKAFQRHLDPVITADDLRQALRNLANDPDWVAYNQAIQEADFRPLRPAKRKSWFVFQDMLEEVARNVERGVDPLKDSVYFIASLDDESDEAKRRAEINWAYILRRYNHARTDKKEPSRPHLDRLRNDWLPKQDITPEQLMARFGFRAVEFGEWLPHKERQIVLNHAYAACEALAEVLGISDKAVSLNGRLAVAFGSRGRGGRKAASAHYEPDRKVFNLTRMKGAGSMAHEWAHALDHYMGELFLEKPLSYASDDPEGGCGFLSRLTPFPDLMNAIRCSGDLNWKRSQYLIDAEALDSRKRKTYWSKPTELFARAFECYVYDTLQKMQRPCDYLVHSVDENLYKREVYGGNPYPTGEERVRIYERMAKLCARLPFILGPDVKLWLACLEYRGSVSLEDKIRRVKEALAAGANPNSGVFKHYAEPEIRKLLIENGLDMRAYENRKAALSNRAIADIFLEKGYYSIKDDINLIGDDGYTFLLYAVFYRNLKVIDALLAAGADPEIACQSKSFKGVTALELVFKTFRDSQEDLDVAERLIDAGAKVTPYVIHTLENISKGGWFIIPEVQEKAARLLDKVTEKETAAEKACHRARM